MFIKRRKLQLITLVMVFIIDIILIWISELYVSSNSETNDWLPENMEKNFVKSSKFENLSDWILTGTIDNSFQQISNPPGIFLYNELHEGHVSAHVLKQIVLINQTLCAPIRISLWSKANVVVNETQSTFLEHKFSLYADLELQSGKQLWGYVKVLSFSSDWQKTELTLDFSESLVKIIYLHIIFKIPGKLWVSDVSVIEMPPVPVLYRNTSLSLHYVPFKYAKIPKKSMATPLLVSAIILNWKRPVNLIAIVCNLLHYPFLTEIIVWNNNPNLTLQLQHFLDYNDLFSTSHLRKKTMILMNKIRIINSPNNVHDFGRWLACSYAQNSICYIQDDDYEPCYMNSLYANLQLHPHLVHLVTIPAIILEHRRWMLWNSNINLHANFAWLGAGSFVPKRLAQQFLRQLSFFSLEAKQLLYADMLFSLWTNDPAYKLSALLRPLSKDKVGFSDTHDHWKIVFHTINRAARILQNELSKNSRTKIFNRKQSIPLYDDRTSQAICHNDKCILITNYQMFMPLKASITYNQSISIREQEQYYPYLTHEWFIQFGYQNAVDGDRNTIWQVDFKDTNNQFYFGLDLLRTHYCSSIQVYSSNLTQTMLETIKIYASLHGNEWKLMFVTFQLTNINSTLKRLEIYPLHEKNTIDSYRYFRIYLNQPNFPLFINEIKANCSLVATSTYVVKRKQRPMVTAIFLSWIRLNEWSKLFSHISKYDFIDEIIFWNNNPNITFNSTILYSYLRKDRRDISLKLINSNSNMYFFARFLACNMAKNTICFFQDDDWQIDQLNALYQNYLQYPHLLHTYTNPLTHHYCWTWSATDASVHMHTTFNWLGTGALVSKKSVEKFIEIIGQLLGADQNIYADMFFSTWLNDYHYQLTVNLNEINNALGFSDAPFGKARNKYFISKGVNILHEHLKSKTSTLFSRDEKLPSWQDRIVRSPCFDDNCLFISNIHALPSPMQITTNLSLDLDGRAKQVADLMSEQRFNEWLSYSYHHAVDKDKKTCYYVYNSSINHYFGLDLFYDQLVRYIYIRYEGMKSATNWLEQFAFEITTDRDPDQWNTVLDFQLIYIDQIWIILSLPELIPMERFRFRCIHSFCVNYKICHLSFIDDFNINPCHQLCRQTHKPCLPTDKTLCEKCYCN